MRWERQVPRGRGNADAEADSRAVANFYTDLDEEERSIGGGVATDVNSCQDDGRHEEDRQHNAHDGAQVHGGVLCLGGQVVLKAYKKTVMGSREGGATESGF